MTNIEINDTYDKKLKSLVVDPFEQTRVSIIQDLIDAELARRAGNGSAPAATVEDGVTIPLKPMKPGDLKHTRIVSAIVNGVELHRPKWSSLREEMHLLGMKRLLDLKKVRAVSNANVRPDKYEKDGYKYLPQGKFSIQGVDSNWSWTHSLKLAQHLKVPVKLVVQWREKDDAAYPGKFGSLEYVPE